MATSKSAPRNPIPKFRIYPSIGIARMGNGPAKKDEVIFSPEIPWANIFDTEQDYLTDEGQLKKQAQRFTFTNVIGQVNLSDKLTQRITK